MAASRAPTGESPQVSNSLRISPTATWRPAGRVEAVTFLTSTARARVSASIWAEAPGFAQGAAHGGQDVVDGGGLGAAIDEQRAQRLLVLVADLGPVDHQRTGGEPASKDLGGAIEGALQTAATDRRRPAGEVDEGGIGIGRAGDRDDPPDRADRQARPPPMSASRPASAVSRAAGPPAHFRLLSAARQAGSVLIGCSPTLHPIPIGCSVHLRGWTGRSVACSGAQRVHPKDGGDDPLKH